MAGSGCGCGGAAVGPCGDVSGSVQFVQSVRSFDLGTASSGRSDADADGWVRIPAAAYDSYIAAFTAEAEVSVKLGSASADSYNLYRVPVRRSGTQFREVFLKWAAASGVSLVFILGQREDAGVR